MKIQLSISSRPGELREDILPAGSALEDKLYKKEQQWINDFVPMSDDSGKKDNSSSCNKSSKKNQEQNMMKRVLVKERYEITSPEGYDLLLWGDLKTLFEPSEEDEIWKNQQDYNLISWRLFDSCRVHVLLMDTELLYTGNAFKDVK
ncbi:hypothetical protein Tco_0503833 [Tanacetum coccineum]